VLNNFSVNFVVLKIVLKNFSVKKSQKLVLKIQKIGVKKFHKLVLKIQKKSVLKNYFLVLTDGFLTGQ